jgi:hypothetical protein
MNSHNTVYRRACSCTPTQFIKNSVSSAVLRHSFHGARKRPSQVCGLFLSARAALRLVDELLPHAPHSSAYMLAALKAGIGLRMLSP